MWFETGHVVQVVGGGLLTNMTIYICKSTVCVRERLLRLVVKSMLQVLKSRRETAL